MITHRAGYPGSQYFCLVVRVDSIDIDYFKVVTTVTKHNALAAIISAKAERYLVGKNFSTIHLIKQ